VASSEPRKPTPEELKILRDNRCDHCGGVHARACPRVKRLAFHPNGAVAEVEFWRAGSWPEDQVVWLDEEDNDDETEGVTGG